VELDAKTQRNRKGSFDTMLAPTSISDTVQSTGQGELAHSHGISADCVAPTSEFASLALVYGTALPNVAGVGRHDAGAHKIIPPIALANRTT
jgi:hypothetical protein